MKLARMVDRSRQGARRDVGAAVAVAMAMAVSAGNRNVAIRWACASSVWLWREAGGGCEAAGGWVVGVLVAQRSWLGQTRLRPVTCSGQCVRAQRSSATRTGSAVTGRRAFGNEWAWHS